jgi:signal transduction histidine kinase
MQKVHWLAKPRSWLAAGLMVLLSPVLAQATTQSIDEIQWARADGQGFETIELPHFVEQDQSGLQQVRWRIRLPEAIKTAELPTLLLPQPIQGFRLRWDGELIHELTPSDSSVLRHWYSPALIQLPKSKIQNAQDLVLEFEQTGHLRTWVIAPLAVGEWQVLKPMADRYAFVSDTLATSVNVVCVLLGLFLLAVGRRLQLPLYQYSGWIAILWSALMGIAYTDSVPAVGWFVWRLSLYAITGYLIYFQIRFNFAMENQTLSHPLRWFLLIFLNAGWVTFVLMGRPAEVLLDTWWTGLAVAIYALNLAWILVSSIARKHWRNTWAILFFLTVSMSFALHDYGMQTGLNLWGDQTVSDAFEPMYLTHLILPVFLVMTLWLVGKDFIVLNQAQARLVGDIHDGVGSRINLLLWSLRTTQPTATHITHELQRCVDELRFAINPASATHQTLHQALSALIDRLQAHAPPGLVLTYEHTGESTQAMPSDIGLHLYKAVHECLSNALRHSAASRISVRLDQRNQGVEVSVSDNGRGIPRWSNEQQVQIDRSASSLGLMGLRSRMQSRQGRCTIESSALGTHVRLAFDV